MRPRRRPWPWRRAMAIAMVAMATRGADGAAAKQSAGRWRGGTRWSSRPSAPSSPTRPSGSARSRPTSDGTAEVALDMPENLTTWRIKVWGMGHGTRVGQGQTDVVTRKDLIVRLEAPRFFVADRRSGALGHRA